MNSTDDMDRLWPGPLPTLRDAFRARTVLRHYLKPTPAIESPALSERMGCRFTQKGSVDTGKCEATNVPGLFVAGDASKEAQFVAIAAAEGTEAGMAIHKALMKEDLP